MNKIEVFIATWNSEKTIENCLKSIKNTIPLPDIVIFDRNSTDGTKSIAECYGAKIISGEWNVGETRSLMCKFAKGKWFIMVDSDVYLEPDWFKVMVRYKDEILKYDSFVGALHGQSTPIYEPFRSYVLFQRKNWIYPVKNIKRLDTCNTMLNRDAVKKFQTNAAVFEDYLLGEYLKTKGYNYYEIPAQAKHDAGQKDKLKRHARWAGAGMRKYGGIPFWKMFAALIRNPLSMYPLTLKRFGFFLHWNWLMGWVHYKKYLES